MYKIILDCDLMRYKDSGLYHYCLNLGSLCKKALDREVKGVSSFYVPSSEKKSFGNDAGCIVERKWHQRFW